MQASLLTQMAASFPTAQMKRHSLLLALFAIYAVAWFYPYSTEIEKTVVTLPQGPALAKLAAFAVLPFLVMMGLIGWRT
ncbi:MAG: hypothetical protein K0S28_1925, partial [Paucimonas sp.]|nr:hypothetical protein [Paucimonas sp.]